MKIVCLSIAIMIMATSQNRNRKHRDWVSEDVADKWVENEKVQGCATANSQGKGSSMVMTGKNGSAAKSNGTKGSDSSTIFNNDKHTARENWSNYMDSHGNSKKVNNTWTSDEKNANNANAIAKGKGETKAISDDKTSGAAGKGTLGTKVDSIFRHDQTDKADNWASQKHGNTVVDTRDQWVNKDLIQTKGTGKGIGNGVANTVSNDNGSQPVPKEINFLKVKLIKNPTNTPKEATGRKVKMEMQNGPQVITGLKITPLKVILMPKLGAKVISKHSLIEKKEVED
jgi:hypothetical protein